MQLHFSVTFACGGNVEILVSTWCGAEVVHILKMILGKNYRCADSPGLHVYKSAVCKSASLQVCKSASLQVCKSASLQVCRSASLQVCSPQVSHTGSGLPAVSWKKHFPESHIINPLFAQACSVKMTGYWPRLLLWLYGLDSVLVHKQA